MFSHVGAALYSEPKVKIPFIVCMLSHVSLLLLLLLLLLLCEICFSSFS